MARVTPSERFERELDEVLTGVDGELARLSASGAWARASSFGRRSRTR